MTTSITVRHQARSWNVFGIEGEFNPQSGPGDVGYRFETDLNAGSPPFTFSSPDESKRYVYVFVRCRCKKYGVPNQMVGASARLLDYPMQKATFDLILTSDGKPYLTYVDISES